MGMIMPSVFEGMLNFLMISMKADLYRWYEDQTWKGAWIRFAGACCRNTPPLMKKMRLMKLNSYGMHQSGLVM